MEKHVLLPGRRGFTLIELMVVVAIIGILMAAGIVAFSGAQRTARDAKRKADVKAIAAALEMEFSNSSGGLYISYNNVASSNTLLGSYFPAGQPPENPLIIPSTLQYDYWLRSNGSLYNSYCVVTRLETNSGNCDGLSPASGWYKCAFNSAPGRSYFCVQNQQGTQ